MNDLIKSFEARGWEFSFSRDPIAEGYDTVLFKSPRMHNKHWLCNLDELEYLTKEQIEEKEIDTILGIWKYQLLLNINENIIKDIAQQYKLLMMKGIEPPRSQKISFDVEWKL